MDPYFQKLFLLPEMLIWKDEESILNLEKIVQVRHPYRSYNNNQPDKRHFPVGGILSDQVGLGKTF